MSNHGKDKLNHQQILTTHGEFSNSLEDWKNEPGPTKEQQAALGPPRVVVREWRRVYEQPRQR